MTEEVEYLSEWPPLQNRASKRQKSGALQVIETQSLKKVKMQCTVDDTLSLEENELISRPSSVPISTILALWWKQNLRCGKTSQCSSDPSEYDALSTLSHNPHTLLHHICKQPKTRHFLTARIKYLESLPPDSETNHALATTHHQMLNYSTALGYACKAVEEDTSNQELMWTLELLMRQNNVIKTREERLATVSLSNDINMPQTKMVERRSADSLSYEEFFRRYALTHTPVVITDVVKYMTTQPWTFDYIKQVIGDKVAPLRRVVTESVEWAKLEPAGEVTVSSFIDSLCQQDQATLCESKYLFDWSIPLNCPELAKQLTIPRYFAGDFLQRTPPGSLYRDSWPSLFISPAGITSELHVDAFGSNFWMALFQGKKRWVFFPPKDLPLLYPTYPHSTDAVFEVNLSQPDLTHHPALSLTHPTECILSPGELLFVPAGSPHRVENLEPSLAISANYVDSSNFDGVIKELGVNFLRDYRARTLLQVLEGPDFNRSPNYEQNDLSWNDFKS